MPPGTTFVDVPHIGKKINDNTLSRYAIYYAHNHVEIFDGYDEDTIYGGAWIKIGSAQRDDVNETTMRVCQGVCGGGASGTMAYLRPVIKGVGKMYEQPDGTGRRAHYKISEFLCLKCWNAGDRG